MTDPITIPPLQEIAQWGFANPRVAAPIAVFIASYVLYGVLGKKMLGADDDYWERIRAWLLPRIASLAKQAGGYIYTTTGRNEYAGYTDMPADAFERKLRKAGYLRQPVASLHRNERGWVEDGSWSRTYGALFAAEAVAHWFTKGRIRIPILAEVTRRFLHSLNTVLALRQYHIVYYVEGAGGDDPRVYVYCHKEYNPLNPLTAPRHYAGDGFEPSPQVARTHLKRVGVELTKPD